MITRQYPLPDHSFFLLGPRGTGKTTWLKQVLPTALWFDLLRTQTVLELSRQAESFRQRIEAQPRGTWVVVDEVQRLPSLLNEVHALIADHPRAYRFALLADPAIPAGARRGRHPRRLTVPCTPEPGVKPHGFASFAA